MTLNEAFKKAIEKYWDGEEPKSMAKAKEGGLKYNKKFLDSFEEKAKGGKI